MAVANSNTRQLITGGRITLTYYGRWTRFFAQGNAQGITFVASSGDQGGLLCPTANYGTSGANPTFVPGVSTPADDPNVTAVGGGNLVTTATSGSLNSAYVRESAFGDPQAPYDIYGLGQNVSGGYWGAGGGVSPLFAKPLYQVLAKTGSSRWRTLPDVGEWNEHATIVGLWHVLYTATYDDNFPPGGPYPSTPFPFLESFKTWHGDGTEFENAFLPPSGGNICFGVWKDMGKGTVKLHHIGLMFNPDGSLSAIFTDDETNTVASNGKTYKGMFDFKLWPPSYDAVGVGKPIAEVKGTIVATRITVD